MKHKEPVVPNVWICLQKIKKYVQGTYKNKRDVLLCIDTMEKMFEKPSPIPTGCRNGWTDNEIFIVRKLEPVKKS
jgi:hypothetical protein